MKKLIVLITILASLTAYAVQSYLVSSTVQGQWRYCQYSDGRVITIKAYQICPVSLR